MKLLSRLLRAWWLSEHIWQILTATNLVFFALGFLTGYAL